MAITTAVPKDKELVHSELIKQFTNILCHFTEDGCWKNTLGDLDTNSHTKPADESIPQGRTLHLPSGTTTACQIEAVNLLTASLFA